MARALALLALADVVRQGRLSQKEVGERAARIVLARCMKATLSFIAVFVRTKHLQIYNDHNVNAECTLCSNPALSIFRDFAN